jgi:predicted anti-sigma-YlaC factor YlaD
MNNHEHERAIDIITRQGVDDVAASDIAWLESHLAQCSECAEYAALVAGTGQLLRAVAVAATPALVSTTQARVRARAAQLREHQARVVLIAVSFCIGVLSSTVSAWLWWKVGGWVAEHIGLPSSYVAPGILLFWLLPAIAIAVIMLAFPHPVFEKSLMLSLAREREGEIR